MQIRSINRAGGLAAGSSHGNGGCQQLLDTSVFFFKQRLPHSWNLAQNRL